MASKKEMIKNGNDISLDEGNVVVINSGISLAEKEEISNTEASVEAPTVDLAAEVAPITIENSIPLADENPIAIETPIVTTEIPSIEPIVAPTVDVTQPVGNSFEGVQIPTNAFSKSPIYPGIGVASVEPSVVVEPTAVVPEAGYNDFFQSGVYKSSEDVDLAATAFLNETKEAYYRNIVEPTKAAVELLNACFNWGNRVTTQGLNKALFEEFDDLNARYEGMEIAKYGDDKVADIKTPYGNDSNNYGGMAA